MRLALIVPARTDRQGGVQRFAASLADALERQADIGTYRLHPGPGKSRLPAAARGVRELLRDHRHLPFDAVLSTFHWPPRFLRVPTFGTIHDLRTMRSRRLEVGRLAQAAVARSWTAVFVPSRHVADEVTRRLGARRVITIGEGLDHLDDLRPATQPPRTLLTVLAGRSPHKRNELGVAAALLASQRCGGDVVIVGGPWPAEAIAGVRVVESPDDRELVRILASTRVAIVASSYEGFGLATGEALRAGAPVVYAVDGTLGPLVDGGGLAAAARADAMADAALALWERGDAARRAAEAAASQYTWVRTATRVLEAVRAARPPS